MFVVLLLLVYTVNVMGQDQTFFDYKAKAENGDGYAQGQVSCAYYFGNWGVTKNPSEAFRWALKSDMTHDEFGEYMLGLCYFNAVGTSRDYYKAAIQFEKSYQHRRSGGAGAAYNLAYCYYYGVGKTKDAKQALYYFEKAIESGELGGQSVVDDAQNKIQELRKNATPYNNETTISLLSSTSSASTSYNLRVGIKSSSRVTSYDIFVNGQKVRGIVSVNNDGYDMVVNMTITLQNGQNTIRVEIVSSSGTTSKDFYVTVSGNGNYVNNYSSTGKRVALVIGNSNYPNSPLKNPVNDATDIATKLNVLGFDVTLKTDLSFSSFESTLQYFQNKANNAEVALLYYAGHGMEIGGRNYLIPVDAPLGMGDQLKYKSVDANFALDVISGASKKIIILDACRNQPGSRGINDGGLAPMSATNACFAYSTSPGKTAPDGYGRNSPYTSSLLQVMGERGLTLHQLFQKVARIVTAKNSGQIPWFSSSMVDDVILNR